MTGDTIKKPSMNPLLIQKLLTVLTGLGITNDLIDQIKSQLNIGEDKPSVPETKDMGMEGSEPKSTDPDSETEGKECSIDPTEEKAEGEQGSSPEAEKIKTGLLHMLNGSTPVDGEKDPKKILSNIKGIKIISLN